MIRLVIKRFGRRFLGAASSSILPEDLHGLFSSSLSRDEIYSAMQTHYAYRLPLQFIRHREYFRSSRRGFGEDAFHSMWYLAFKQFRPVHCLEIGVYRGQTLTLWQLLSRQLGYTIHCAGVSPFSSAGDSSRPHYDDLDYLADTKLNHDRFGLQHPEFCIGLSDSEEAQQFIASRKWDLIYIDGNHDYDVVRKDLRLSIDNLADTGVLVMDDSSLYFDYHPRDGSFAGHPGPSRVAREIAQHELRMLGGVGHNNVFVKR